MEYKTLGGWSEHMHRHHPDEIPEGFTDLQYFYYTITGKKSGACVQCHKPTDWNEATGKYNRYCNNPKCKEQYCKVAKKRMIDKYGKIHLLNDPEMQRKMLSNRKIAGTYTFSDGSGKVPYVASYEKDFLMTMDTVLGLKATDIMSPSPHNYVYMYEGKPHFYIPDFYIPSLNLEIEIKDDQNGPNANKHPKIAAVDRVKEALKDETMAKNKSVNYFKVMDKSYTDFFKYVLELKECIDDDLKNTIVSAMAIESVNDPVNSFEMALERALEYDDDEEFNGEGDYGFEIVTEAVSDHVIDKLIAFNNKMNSYDYGIAINDKILPNSDTTDNFMNKYTLASPSQFEKQHGGVCCDYVTYEAECMKKMLPNVSFTCWYIIFDDGDNQPAHTFLTLKHGTSFILFESAFGAIKGVWLANSEADLINFEISSMIENDKHLANCKCKVYKYNALDKNIYGIGMVDFMQYIHNNAKIINHKFDNKFNVTKIGDESALESVNKSKIDKDFESKGHMNLSSFKCTKLTHELRKKYESESKMLKHAWENDATHDARIWLDGDKMVAHVCVFTARKKDPRYDGYNWISSLEVSPEYRGYGLGKQLLDFAVDTMGGTALGVYKDNEIAIKMYKDKGFKFLDKKSIREKYPNYHNNAAGLMVLGSPAMEVTVNSKPTESLHFETPKELHTWMKNNFSYANFTKLLSPEELVVTKKGSCHDQALFAYTYLKKMGLKPKLLFFIAYKEGEVVGGMTHTLCFYEQDNKVWWFETAWNGAIGLRSYPTENTMRVDIFRRYMNLPDAKKFPELEFKTISPEKPGVNLAQYVDKALEVALTTDERTDFGIPSLKKYPMPDPDHVKAAIRMFNHVDDDHEEELANNILKYIKKYKMTDINVGKDNRFHKYYSPSEDAVITDVASQVPYGGNIIQRPMN